MIFFLFKIIIQNLIFINNFNKKFSINYNPQIKKYKF
jgi:hypothetical protein